MSIAPLSSPTYYPSATLTKPKEYPGVFLVELHARPDNRLTNEFLRETLMPILSDVEREFLASRRQNLAPADASTSGWKEPKAPGEYALVTCGPRDKNRFYSNGLELESALTTEGFFQHVIGPVYARLLTFPIPTVCAINGHAFAAGFCLALCHDFRVMKEGEAKGKANMAMNEVEFGAPVPPCMVAVIEAKMPTRDWARRCLSEAFRFGANKSLEIGLVDQLAPESQVVDEALKLAFTKTSLSKTGVYGVIKSSLYKDTLNEMVQFEGFIAPHTVEDIRMQKLGEQVAGKAKL